MLELQAERIQHAIDAVFGRGVGGVVRQRDLALDGRDRDEASAAVSLHDRYRGQGGKRLPGEADVDDALELVRSRGLERRVHGNGGRLHPGVQPAELAFGRQRHRFDLCKLGGIRRHGQCLAAELSDFRDQLVQRFSTPGGHHDARPRLRKRQGRQPANVPSRRP